MSTTLTPPSFIATDSAVVEQEMVDLFEQTTGRTLHPAQPERVFIALMAYRETLLRQQIQDVGLQNLVAFARYPMLDFLGEIVGAERLPAQPATTTLRFTLSAPQAVGVKVPAGTRVQTADGTVTFATDVEFTIPAGAAAGDIGATAAEVGLQGNGYAIGAVKTILDPTPFVASASNVTLTAGGADIETDDRYRDRVRRAPSQFSVAGSVGAYRYHALSADSTIIDVAISSSAAGIVRVTVLTETGLPSAALLTDVANALSADRVRPLTDSVQVVSPTEVQYQITATVRLLSGVDAAVTLAAVSAAAEAYAASRRAGLGRDVVRSQIVAALGSVAGVYDVTLAAPAADLVVEGVDWANCTAITLTQGATADG